VAAPSAIALGDVRTDARTPSASAIDRADELLRQMTIEEKAMQLSALYPMGLLGADGPIKSQLDAQVGQGIGHICGLGLLGHKSPATIAKTVNAIQRYLVTETRLKIPAIFHNEALNGVVAPHFTHFPTPIGLAATWDPHAVEEMADLMRRQMRSVGMLQALSPVLDVARDARWGRVHETYGEDPYLVAALGVAFTRGMQGKDLREGVLASAKHFIGYAVTDAGQNMAATAVGPRELYEVYVSLTITNTGKRRGTEIVQLYAADTATGITLPAQQLVGFARVDLEPGATKTVTFVVPLSVLAYTGVSGNLIMEPGPVELSAGSSSSDIRSSATFTVTGTTRIIKGADRAFLSEATVG
jgi:Glycosyl hydrolase family 3 N terminal domain/Fibronectin type III-like domain